MEFLEILILAVGVSMDAFAVSICKGITIKENIKTKALIVGTWFASFQGMMPLIGYYLTTFIESYLSSIKEYVIFALLVYVGIVMIVDSFSKEELSASLGFKEMLMLSIATSLDALSVGATISLLNVNIYASVTMIALITFMFCFFGTKIGAKFGDKYKSKAEIIGGLILIGIGLKILLEYILINI